MADLSKEAKAPNFFGVGLEKHKQFNDWWSVARQSVEPPSPQEFLVNFGVDGKLVDQIMRTILRDSCPAYGRLRSYPGYFAHYYAPLISSNNEGGEIIKDQYNTLEEMLQTVTSKLNSNGGQWENQPTEQDLLAVAEATNPMNWERIILICMAGNYSAGFLQSMARKVSSDDRFHLDFSRDSIERFISNLGCPGFRLALDHDCVSMIKILLPNLKTVSLAGKWGKEAFSDCIGLMCQSTSLALLNLSVPDCLLYASGDEESERDCFVPLPDRLENAGVCAIETYELNTMCSDTELGFCAKSPWFGVNSPALMCLHRMTQLQVLNISCYALPLHSAVKHIVQLLQYNATQLKHLVVGALVTAENPTVGAVLDILEALNNNSSLQSFSYTERTEQVSFQFGPYEKKLLQVLAGSNTTITNVRLSTLLPEDDYLMFAKLQTGALRPHIDYYLELNKHGRGVARDASAKIADFVAMLVPHARPGGDDDGGESSSDEDSGIFENGRWSFSDDDDDDSGGEVEKNVPSHVRRFQINYGLLREMPGAWSAHVCSAYDNDIESRKRKRDQNSSA